MIKVQESFKTRCAKRRSGSGGWTGVAVVGATRPLEPEFPVKSRRERKCVTLNCYKKNRVDFTNMLKTVNISKKRETQTPFLRLLSSKSGGQGQAALRGRPSSADLRRAPAARARRPLIFNERNVESTEEKVTPKPQRKV